MPKDLRDIAEVEPEAVALIGDLMLHNARELETLFEHMYEDEKKRADEWQERALEAEAKIWRVRKRFLVMFEDDDGYFDA